MPSYRFSISAYSDGSSPLVFLANPLNVENMVTGERPYSEIPVISGTAFKQFSTFDTRKKSFAFDVIPEERVDTQTFIFGETENDANCLMYLKKLDSDGCLQIFYLNIPSPLTLLRPEGYRTTDWIPVRILDVVAIPSSPQGKIRWNVTLYYEIVPAAEIISSSSSSSSSSGSSGSSSSSSVGSSSSSSSSSESSSSSSSE